MNIKADYKNWVPKGMIYGLMAGTGAKMQGIDRWGKEYASFSKQLCESKLKAQGYEEVKLIRTDDGKFMTKIEAKRLGLTGSIILFSDF